MVKKTRTLGGEEHSRSKVIIFAARGSLVVSEPPWKSLFSDGNRNQATPDAYMNGVGPGLKVEQGLTGLDGLE